jgi:selenocysteine lyase/cysteine desulfurase
VRPAAGDINKLGHVGTVPPAPVLAVADALAFHDSIGSHNKEARLRYLTQYWLSQVRTLPKVQVFTPRAPERSCAIAAFGITGIPAAKLAKRLMAEHRIFTVVREIAGGEGVRVTPHLFTTSAQLDLLVFAIKNMAAASE